MISEFDDELAKGVSDIITVPAWPGMSLLHMRLEMFLTLNCPLNDTNPPSSQVPEQWLGQDFATRSILQRALAQYFYQRFRCIYPSFLVHLLYPTRCVRYQ